ncbi:hypothetical protein LOK49_LG15G02106 [Camellia lanceoleosa]|uniref:Uncharacterized protein n=1 Tax=Camellia lanceoleosa TaxID=1840588 RepID=A0ACC0F878_9ERIC|nr:hypothetical protein LOK49_LG15G02106 [Camellia lanceoleosa]
MGLSLVLFVHLNFIDHWYRMFVFISNKKKKRFTNIRKESFRFYFLYDIAGIDFGTSTSLMAIMDARGLLANSHFYYIFFIFFFNIKTLLGRKFHDSQIQELKTKVPYKINEGSNGEAWMKRLGESYLGRSISKVVIVPPIYFNDAQKKRTRVGRKTCASLSRLASKNIDGGIFAALGGGTFNISILEISDGVIEVKAKEFDSSLRGEDFDLVLVEYMVEEIRRLILWMSLETE